MRLQLLLFVLFYSLYNTLQATEPVVINLENDHSRHLLQVEGKLLKVKLCQLKVGESYMVRSVMQSGSEVLLLPEIGGTATPVQSFTATTSCQSLLLQRADPQSLPSMVYLSINCMSCPIQSVARPPNLQVDPGGSALSLVEDVLIGGGCFDIENASFIGNSDGVGTFSAGEASIGLEDGVIISSGNVTNAPGPNNQEGAGNDFGGGGDPDLAQLANGGEVNDATGLQFEFTPTIGQIAFNYVFASEEYCEYVGSQFNDVFGFFISGPGISGGFTFDGENIAVIPSTNTPVAINTVNQNMNTGFFVGNSNNCGSVANSTDIQFDGYTSVLTAVANVEPCQKYTIRLLVGDVGDGIFDSAVFLEANSFSAGGSATGEAISPTTGTNVTYEACSDGYFVLEAAGNINEDRIVEFFVSPLSTATAGADYAPLPTSVTIPAGESQVIVPITVFEDDLIEGPETIILGFQNPCSCVSDFIELVIEDVPPMIVDAFSSQVCAGEETTLEAIVTGGLPGYTYSWEDDDGFTYSGSTITVSPTEPTAYTVTVTDECGDFEIAQAFVNVFPLPEVQMFGGGQFCGDDFSTDLQVNFSGSDGPWLFTYSIDGVFQLPIEVDTTPYFIEATEGGLYLPESVLDVNTLCEGPVMGAAFIETLDFEVEFNSTNISCPGADDGTIEVNALNGVSPFSYNWQNVTEGVPILGGGDEQTDLAPGVYAITAVDNQNCIDSAQIEIVEPDTLRANAQIQAVPNCYDTMGGSVGLDLQGGTPGFSFQWSNADTTQNLNNLGPGEYTVTVTDSQGCLDSTSVLVEEDLEPPLVDISVEDTLTCEQNEVLIDATNSSAGSQFSYNWTGPGIVVGQTNPVVVVNEGGTYTLEITNDANGCTASQSITVEENTVVPVANAQDDILNCYQPELSIDATGSSTGASFNYQWNGPGILNGGNTLTPLVDAAGDYQLVVTDERNGCVDTISVTVDENFDTPQAEAGTGGLLTCDEPEFTLNASVPGSTDNLRYDWSSADGNFVSGADGLNPVVDADGVYELVVTDTVSGCSASDQVVVNQDPNLPIAIVNGGGTLTCSINSIELDAENSNLAPDGQYEWFSPNGQFASGANTLSPVINEPGDYFLVISGGPSSLCQDTAVVTIPEDTTPPDIDFSTPEVLTCETTSFGLQAAINTSTGQFTTQWNGPAGTIAGAPDATAITVEEPGAYSLVVTDTGNGCTSAGSVPVTQDVTPPVAAISTPSTINCGTATVDLDGSGSSTGAEFSYEWQAPDGSSLAETSSVLPAVSDTGTYTLEVLNTDNGCRSSTSVEVLEDINYPDVSIAAPDVLDCANTELSLNSSATGTSPEPDLVYAWGTTDGSFVSGSANPDPLIDEPGTYSLTVTDASNNCVSTQQVSVTEDVTAPTVDAGPGTTLDCQNTSYTLSGSINGTSNFDLQWSTTDGDIASGTDGLTPTVTSAGTYSLEVVNLDNSCSSISTVVIEADTDLPDISVNTGGQIDCGNPTALIDASASDDGPSFQYTWTLPDGSTVPDSSAIVATAAGNYSLEIVNTDNQCTNTRDILVEEDLEAPVAEAGADAILNCFNPSLQLNGSGSSQGADMAYEWSRDGALVSTDISPVIDQPGTYELSVRNEDNQCLSTDVVDVQLDTVAPLAAVANPAEINCDVTQITIDGSGSSQGNNFAYDWTSPDGNILSGGNTLSPTVDQGGNYILNVQNTENGCESSASVQVPENADYPTAEAGTAVVINCDNPTPSLNASASSQGAAFTYEWQGPGLLSGNTSLSPAVDQPGEYTLTVFNNDNGCASTDVVMIERDTARPELLIASPEELNCGRTSLAIDASAGNQGPEFQYSWNTTDGNILQGDDTATPLIDAPGTYTATLLNTDNGCSRTNSVQVEEDITAPTASVTPPEMVTCAQPTVSIDASASSSGPNFTYEWTTTDGAIDQGANTLSPVVSQGGTYQLLLTNTSNQCTETIEIVVEQDTQLPSAEAGEPVVINCYEPNPTLDATASSQGANFSYEWDGPSVTSGGNTLNPAVAEPGNYSLLITNTANGCTASDAVMIGLDTMAPSVQIAEPAVLNCALTEQTINASGSSQGAEFEYEWSTVSGGNILSGGSTATPLIDAPGAYSLLITDTENGCSQSSSVEVEQDIETPEIDIDTPDTLTCVVEEVSIDAGTSSNGPTFTYQWQPIGGNITGGSTSLFPTVNEGGVYELTILNTENQCSSTAEVQVIQDVETPVAEAGSPQELNCDAPSLQLDAAGSSQGDFSYNWTGPGVVSGGNSMSPIVNQPGAYQLLVTDNFNGCTAEDQVSITQDTALPTANILEPELLTCAVESLTLNANASSQGNEFVYQWSTSNGNILNGADGLAPTIDQPGLYTLSVFNTDNECENTDQVEVGQDIEPPVAEAGEGFLLDCWEETDFLDASGSSEGPEFQYSWSTDDGILVAQQTTIQPEIGEPGTYTLTVLDTDNGCSSTDEVTVTQTIPVSEVALQQPDCFGDLGNLSFVNIEGGTAPFLYSIDGGDNFLPSPDFRNLQPGDYDLVVRDINGCEFRAPAEIIQPDSLTAIITEASAELEFGDTYQINTIVNFPEEELAAIHWTNDSTLSCQDCLRPVAKPLRTTVYRLEVATENGCSDETEIRIFVNRDKPIYVPNIFSPNGDGSNDRFYIFSKEGVVEHINTFQIYNRWGETVFEIYDSMPNDPNQGWDGSFRGDVMNSAVFTWYAEIEFVDGSVELFKGDVTLLR